MRRLVSTVRWPRRDIDFYFYSRHLFLIRDSFFFFIDHFVLTLATSVFTHDFIFDSWPLFYPNRDFFLFLFKWLFLPLRLTYFFRDLLFYLRLLFKSRMKKEVANKKIANENKNRSRCPVQADHSRYGARDHYCSLYHITSFQSSGIIL